MSLPKAELARRNIRAVADRTAASLLPVHVKVWITAEGRGHNSRVWIARFCRRWIGTYLSRADALAACIEYQADRMEPR